MKRTISLAMGFFLFVTSTLLAGEGPSAEVSETLSQDKTKDKLYDGIGLGPEKLWRISPGLEYSTVFDSNVNRERRESADHDVIMHFTPSIALSRIGSNFGILSDYEMDYQLYLRDSDQSSFNHRLNHKMWYKSDRLTAKVSEKFGWVKTYASSEQSERRSVIFNDVNPEVIYHLTSKTSASAIYRNYIFHYKDSVLRSSSYVQNDIGGRLYYHATPKTDLFVQGSAILTDYYEGGAFDSGGFGVYGGAIGEVTDKILLTLKTGFEGREYDNKTINPFYNWVGEAALRYRLTSKTDATLLAKRGIEESVYQNTGWYEFNNVGLNLQYHVRPNIVAQLGGSFQNNQYPRETSEGLVTKKRGDNIAIAETKLLWEPLNHLSLGLGYTFSNRISNFDEYDYIDHLAEASVSYKI
jgi:hypothetical protein